MNESDDRWEYESSSYESRSEFNMREIYNSFRARVECSPLEERVLLSVGSGVNYNVSFVLREYPLKQLLHKVKEETYTNWKVHRKDGLLDPTPRYIKIFQNDKYSLS